VVVADTAVGIPPRSLPTADGAPGGATA